MDRTSPSLRRRPEVAEPTRPPTRGRYEKDTAQEKLKKRSSGKIRTAKDSTEITRVPRTAQQPDRKAISGDDEASARHFTVGNVGANGLLYLKPSRAPTPSFVEPLATPPDTSEGQRLRTEWPSERQSAASGSWTPRPPASRFVAGDQHGLHLPPVTLANIGQKRRPRSHSFSTLGERMRTSTEEQSDFQLLVNGKYTTQRPKSSIDLSEGLLNLHIPHYRLGTPQFSERGTAYLHSSAYTSIIGDEMSAYSRAEYDRLFPVR